MEHRVRAAVLMVEDSRILLGRHVDPAGGDEWWIPPGGGVLPQDRSIIDCAVREVFEEAGLRVSVGKLVYFREFLEESAGVHHFEMFFLADGWSGEPTVENVKGRGQDEHLIRDVAWLGRAELQGLTVYPEHLADGSWHDGEAGFPEPRYLGVQAG